MHPAPEISLFFPSFSLFFPPLFPLLLPNAGAPPGQRSPQPTNLIKAMGVVEEESNC